MTVGELFESVVPRLVNPPTMTLAEAVNTTAAHIFRRLVRRSSDLVMAATTAAFDAGGNTFAMPASSRGVIKKVAVIEEGGTACFRDLYPLESPLDASSYLPGTAGSPATYRLNVGTLEIHPVPARACKVKVWYWNHPAAVSTLGSPVPFDGLFDDIFREAVPRVLALGGLALAADPPLNALLSEGVDSMSSQRQGREMRFVVAPTGSQSGGTW